MRASVPGKKATRGMIGDTMRGNEADFTARVLNGIDETKPDPLVLKIVKDGYPWHTETVTSNDHVLRFQRPSTAATGSSSSAARDRGRLEPDLVRAAAARPGKGCGDPNHAHERAAECKK